MQVGVKTKTQLIDRNAFVRSQGYNLPDKVKKNATQADVDKAYPKMHTNFENTAAASSQLNAKEMQKFLARGAAGHDGHDESAFDGEIARLGGIAAVAEEAEAAAQEETERRGRAGRGRKGGGI